MKFLTSGSAKLHTDVAMTFLAMGVPIMQGYGLTETSPVITTSRLVDKRYGAVGKPIPGVEVKIAPDGEILARGRNIMQGYYRDPEGTAADDRRRVAPHRRHRRDRRERLLAHHRSQEGSLQDGDRQIRLAGARRSGDQAFGLRLASDGDRRRASASGRAHHPELGSACGSKCSCRASCPKNSSKRDDVREFIPTQAREQTADLASFEQIRRVIVLPHEFTVESGELRRR